MEPTTERKYKPLVHNSFKLLPIHKIIPIILISDGTLPEGSNEIQELYIRSLAIPILEANAAPVRPTDAQMRQLSKKIENQMNNLKNRPH